MIVALMAYKYFNIANILRMDYKTSMDGNIHAQPCLGIKNELSLFMIEFS